MGRFRPPSRFIRASIFSSTAIPSKNAKDLVGQTFHILNQFDIPIRSTRQSKGQEKETDSTLLTSVKDPSSLGYFFRSYEDQNIKWVDLNQMDLNAKAIKSYPVNGEQTALDISTSLR